VLGTDNGDVAYDSLVIATGATPRRLEPSGIDGVLTLRSFADAVALRAALGRQPQLVTVGAGLIGCEVAGAAALAGLSVTVVDPMATPMDRSLGPVAGGRVARMLEDVGVRLEMGTGVDAIVGWDRVTGVRLSDGRTLNADLVLLALGAIPAVGWLAGSGVEVRRGVVTDESGRTNIPGVYAAGDVAESYRRLAGAHAVLEHWMNAREQGAAVAAAILGRPPTRGLLPYFWSDQLGKKIQGLGEVGGPGPVHVVEWEAPKPGAIYLYGSAEHLSGAVGFDAARRLMRLRPLIERGATWADAQVLTVSA
jgi:NADPH-dependent 2,4-dienoyl-CoA reductase/sulfur reductase-like enzyme